MTACNGCDTPAVPDPPFMDREERPFEEFWKYDASHWDDANVPRKPYQTRHFVYRPSGSPGLFMDPRILMHLEIKRILRYLKHTTTNGLVLMKPSTDLAVNCYTWTLILLAYLGLMTTTHI